MDMILKQLLDLLSNEKVLTSMQIAASINLSEKTVRSRLKLLTAELENHGATIIGRPGSGFQISIYDEDSYGKWINDLNIKDDVIPSTSSGRVQYIINYLLYSDGYIKLEDLSQMLFVSRNTITADLKQVEFILNLYHLKIIRRPNYGICIDGSELNRRICIANCLYKNNMSHIKITKQRTEAQDLTFIVNNILRKYRLKMTESSFENLIVHTFIANDRIRQGQSMKYSQVARDEMTSVVGEKSIEAALEMTDAIKTKINIDYNEDEILYLALHLSGKVSSDSQGKYGNNLVISSQIDELVLKMLNAVFDSLSLDFRNNLELRMSLNQHMVPLDVRMRYDIPLKNPILEQVKQEYAFAYTVAISACSALVQHYKKDIPEDEIAYFAVLFALAIEKIDRASRKYNIVVVCASGRGTSQLFMYKYKQAFGKYINKIYELTVFDLEELDYKGLEIDYVFTTIRLNINVPVPVYEVSLFLDNKEIDNYQRIFENGDQSFILNYFDRRLFTANLQAETKEEALQIICDYTKQSRDLPEDFYDLVMHREKMGQTDFGNFVAIPHPYHIIDGEKFVMTAILEKPIWWGHNEVQVVFLISLSEEGDEEIEQFYRVITNYLSNSDLVLETIRKPEFNNLISQLKEACKR